MGFFGGVAGSFVEALISLWNEDLAETVDQGCAPDPILRL